jgi:hypothetical protein
MHVGSSPGIQKTWSISHAASAAGPKPYRKSQREKDAKSLTSGLAARSAGSKVVAAQTSLEKLSTLRKNGRDPSLPLC